MGTEPLTDQLGRMSCIMADDRGRDKSPQSSAIMLLMLAHLCSALRAHHDFQALIVGLVPWIDVLVYVLLL